MTKLQSTSRRLSGCRRVASIVAGLLILGACGGGGGGGDGSNIPGTGGGSGGGGGGTTGGTGSATLTWQPPTQNTDGSPLTDLAGYKVKYGTTPGNLDSVDTINNPGISTYVIENLTKTTWYFAVIAVNEAGVESAPSNTVSKLIS